MGEDDLNFPPDRIGILRACNSKNSRFGYVEVDIFCNEMIVSKYNWSFKRYRSAYHKETSKGSSAVANSVRVFQFQRDVLVFSRSKEMLDCGSPTEHKSGSPSGICIRHGPMQLSKV